MTIDELNSKNIKTLADFELLSNRSRQEGLFFVPNSISNIVNPNGTVSSSFYIGSPNSEPEQITSPPNQIPVNSVGAQVSAPVYGPDEIAKLYEGNINNLNFGLGAVSNEDRGRVDGLFVWTSPKYKNNAGKHR